MKKILEYNLPWITYTPPVDCKTTLLLRKGGNTEEALWEHFVTIKNTSYVKDVDFLDNNKWEVFKNLEVLKLPKRYFLKDTMNAVAEWINEGYYLFLIIDSSKISQYANFGKERFRHEILIYGYDDQAGLIYAADYFDYIKYQKRCVPIRELVEAIGSALDIEDDYLNGVYCLRTYEIPEHFRRIKKCFNWHKFYGDLISLICPAETSSSYGFFYFQMLKKEMEENPGVIAVRPFHFLVVHSSFMQMRILYLAERGYSFLERYKEAIAEIVRKSKTLEALHMKNMVNKNSQGVQKEYEILQDIEIGYTRLISQLLDIIKEQIFAEAECK